MKWLKFTVLSCAAMALLSVVSCAQATSESEAKTAIERLDFLAGNWGGEGLSFAEDGTQTRYYDTEHVRFDLDNHLLLINAKGERDGQLTYQLHTVIYYDVEAQHYLYTPYSGRRAARSFNCDLNKQKLICLTEAKAFRLTFQRLADGRWNEFGERLIDDKWRKTFETKLSELTEDKTP